MVKHEDLDRLQELAAENNRLKAENRELKQQAKGSAVQSSSWLEWLRRIGVGLFVALAVLLVFAGNIIFWTGNTVVNTDRYMATVGPLIKNSQVQDTLALYATNQIFNNVDVAGYVSQVLPPRADFLAPQLASQLKNATNSSLKKVLAMPDFQNFWLKTQRQQHQRLINFIKQYKGNGNINLNDIYGQLSDRLKNTKLSFLAGKQLPKNIGSITVVNATWLPTAHKVVTHINTWRVLSIIVTLVSLGLAIWLGQKRRRIVYIFGWATAAAMFITLVGVRLSQQLVASHVDAQYAPGVREAVKVVFHPLVIQTATIMLVALVVVLIAWVSGSSGSARRFKFHLQNLLGGKVHESLFGGRDIRLVNWLQKYKRPVEWAIVGLGAVVLLMARLTPTSLLIYVLVTLVLIIGVEIVGGGPNR